MKLFYLGIIGLMSFTPTQAAHLLFASENNVFLFKDVSSICSDLLADSTTLYGKIIDENGTPLNSASVVIKETSRGSSSDFDGSYKIVLTEREMDYPLITLVFSYVGYANVEKVFTPDQLMGNSSIKLNITFDGGIELQEVEVVRVPFFKRFWNGVKKPFSKKKKNDK